MAGNGGGTSGGGAGSSSTTINAASTAIASADTTRFQPLPPHHRSSRRWTGCFTGLACFGSQKPNSKRIVPAARTPSSNPNPNSQPNTSNQNPNSLSNLSLLAPPSSPASFTNSALPSTAQSPSCFLSPGVVTSANHMFATGPYAHETQLVSPPVFSTFTTEPSTAPLTPPPELAQLTTPSSPDVPFARFLSSQKGLPLPPFNDLQSNYPFYISTSPSSSLISPASVTPRTGHCSPLPEPEPIKTHRSAMSSTCGSPYGPASRNFISAPESPFFHPAGSAQFYLDQAQQTSLSFVRGRTSLSREKQEAEQEVEAYRASFGFSADEIITMQKNYKGVSEAADESFTMCPLNLGERKSEKVQLEMSGGKNGVELQEGRNEIQSKALAAFSNSPGPDVHPFIKHKEENLPKNQESSKRVRPGQSCSDAEIEYRRGRSLRENNGIMAWRNSLP
ncbi:hypothetical protein LUZ60_000075 [Juncus effusus]|nr:hypothetical protein LUZ60_000075 [Juncus effusus]